MVDLAVLVPLVNFYLSKASFNPCLLLLVERVQLASSLEIKLEAKSLIHIIIITKSALLVIRGFHNATQNDSDGL